MDTIEKLLKFGLPIIAALTAAGFAYTKSKKKQSTNSGSVKIKNSKIGGDVAGRDIKK